MITIEELEKIEKEFIGTSLKDLEKMLGFELTEGQFANGEDTPENLVDMYYKIEAVDEDGDKAIVTIFITYNAEWEEVSDFYDTEFGEKEKRYKMPINSENWTINTARLTFDVDYI